MAALIPYFRHYILILGFVIVLTMGERVVCQSSANNGAQQNTRSCPQSERKRLNGLKMAKCCQAASNS